MDNYLVVATKGSLPKKLVQHLDLKGDGIAGIVRMSDAAIAFTCDAAPETVKLLLQRKFRPQETVVLFEIEDKYQRILGTMDSGPAVK